MGRLGYVGTLARDFVAFAREHKAYWIVPLLIVLGTIVPLLIVLGLVALLIATGQASAPFIYTLF